MREPEPEPSAGRHGPHESEDSSAKTSSSGGASPQTPGAAEPQPVEGTCETLKVSTKGRRGRSKWVDELLRAFTLGIARIKGTRLYRRVQASAPARAVRSSLSLRSALAITVAALAVITVFALLVSAQLRTSTFESRRTQILDDAALRFSSAQTVFDQSTAQTPDQVQETARQVVSTINSSAAGAGAVSVVLLRSPDAHSSFRINQITDGSTDLLISERMRTAVRQDGRPQWQSVAIPMVDEEDAPGILVGHVVQLPRAGKHELYIIYSLASDQRQVKMVIRVLFAVALPILIGLPIGAFWLLFSILRPVRRTAEAAKHLAAGDLEARVQVRGEDEMADLSIAFNEMASSLQKKIQEYDELSRLQQRFVSDVSHELRTPLTTIRMADSVIWDHREALPPMAKRSAELLHEQTERMDSLFTDLLEISRHDARSADLAAEVIDLRQVVAKVVAMNAELAERLGVEVRLGGTEERCAVAIDDRRIERVLRNLLVNALEFAEGGPVDLTIGQSDTDVAVRVRDYGVGMSPETAAHVFDRFYRADASRKRTSGGTGLGLSIAAEDVALHGGILEAFGELGHGASFLMTLPKKVGDQVCSEPLKLWED